MTPQQLELKVHEVIGWVLSGGTWEDDLVELKRELIGTQRFARRLAAHANTAHGHPIVWIIGLDEDAREVVGPPAADIASWFPAVEARFDGPAPQLARDMIVTTETDGSTPVLVLAFETDRAPYIIKPRGGSSVDFEIPWRDGTRTRSAKRSEVLRLLVATSLAPDVELLGLHLTIHDKEDRTELHLEGRLMFLPRSRDLVFLPTHRVEAKLTWYSGLAPVFEWSLPADDLDWGDKTATGSHVFESFVSFKPKYEAAFCWAQQDGIYATAPGSVPVKYFTAEFQTELASLEALTAAEFFMRLPVAGTDQWVVIRKMIEKIDRGADDDPNQLHFAK